MAGTEKSRQTAEAAKCNQAAENTVKQRIRRRIQRWFAAKIQKAVFRGKGEFLW